MLFCCVSATGDSVVGVHVVGHCAYAAGDGRQAIGVAGVRVVRRSTPSGG